MNRQPTPRAIMGAVAFGVFVAADDLMVVSTMLRPMIDDFNLVIPDDLGDAAWIVNVYLIAYIAVMPVAGRLSDVVGRRAVFITALTVFGIGSLVVPRADTLSTLLVGRALTAIGGGALVPVAFAVAGDLYVGARRTRALGLLGAVETIGWVWGPLYGAVLVRYLSWQWQFHLNIPLAFVGIVAGWWALGPSDAANHRLERHVDWFGVALLTLGLVAINVALLSQARIQTVTGLEELTDSPGPGISGPALYLLATATLLLFAWNERRVDQPLLNTTLVRQRSVAAALIINCLLSVGLVTALINVPLFVNIVEGGIARSAVRSGWLLTALTTAMAATSYIGGILSGRYGNRAPVVTGLVVATGGLALMGFVWSPETGALTMAVQLGLVGAGIGLVLAPTSATVIDAAGDDERGLAAGLVIVARLIGFSVGLAALTTWGLRRYDAMRADVELPPITDPGYAKAVADATIEISTSALAETFLGAAVVLLGAVAIAAVFTRPAT